MSLWRTKNKYDPKPLIGEKELAALNEMNRARQAQIVQTALRRQTRRAPASGSMKKPKKQMEVYYPSNFLNIPKLAAKAYNIQEEELRKKYGLPSIAQADPMPMSRRSSFFTAASDPMSRSSTPVPNNNNISFKPISNGKRFTEAEYGAALEANNNNINANIGASIRAELEAAKQRGEIRNPSGGKSRKRRITRKRMSRKRSTRRTKRRT